MIPVGVAPATSTADMAERHPRSDNGRTGLDPDRHRGRLPAGARRDTPASPSAGTSTRPPSTTATSTSTRFSSGSAERADVVVDFSAFAGKTLILYNDAPAAFPAGVATYDYYTGVANQMDAGGAPTTLPGYGPNTRTDHADPGGGSFSDAAGDDSDVTLANLQTVFAKTATKRGVFEISQEPIIVPQAAYNSAYDATIVPIGRLRGQYLHSR